MAPSAILAPIGSVDAPFTGTLDGGNHKISSIEIKMKTVFEAQRLLHYSTVW